MFKPLLETVHEFVVPEQAPGSIGEARRYAAGYACNGYIRAQTLDDVAEQLYVFVGPHAQEVFRLFLVFSLHLSAFEYLELVKFDGVER